MLKLKRVAHKLKKKKEEEANCTTSLEDYQNDTPSNVCLLLECSISILNSYPNYEWNDTLLL